MYRNLLIFFFVLLVANNHLLFANDPVEIKSLRVFSSGDETSFPVIDFSSEDKKSITIDFDVQCSSYPSLLIQFRFCDSNWKPYDNAFLLNPLYSYDNNLYLEKPPNNIRGARYHFSNSYPNNNVTFPFSGKWIFLITDVFDRNQIYATGKFFVVIPEFEIKVNTVMENLLSGSDELAILGRTIAIRTKFTLPDSLFSNYVQKVEIIKNRMLEYPIIVDRSSSSRNRFYEWDASQNFTFIARNLRPGNEYRSTDTRDVGKYNSATVAARFGEIDLSDLYTRRPRDMNGTSILLNYKNQNADYQNVLFKFRAPESITKPIFIVGSFTNWKVLPDYEMFDENGMMNLSVPLKRGVYDYQYVTGEFFNDSIRNIDWEILEGNFHETENEYYIFLFYIAQEKGGYEKIIGYKKIKTGVL
jgi:hypothetical protein